MFDPRKLIPLSMEDCSAPMAVMTEITEKTPIVMPIIVSAARSLFAPSDASAIFAISLNNILRKSEHRISKSQTNSERQIKKRSSRQSFYKRAAGLRKFKRAILQIIQLRILRGWNRSAVSNFGHSNLFRISKSGFRISLLISECRHRIEAGGRPCWGETGEQTGENRDGHAYDYESEGELDWKRWKRFADSSAHHVRNSQSNKAAEQTKRRGFDQELKKDRASPRAESFARSDFARALFHAHKRDIHYPDGTDKKRKTSNKKPRDGDRVFDWIQRAFERLLFVDAEVVFFLWRQSTDTPHDSGQLV